jgi:hypothetical protein
LNLLETMQIELNLVLLLRFFLEEFSQIQALVALFDEFIEHHCISRDLMHKGFFLLIEDLKVFRCCEDILRSNLISLEFMGIQQIWREVIDEADHEF